MGGKYTWVLVEIIFQNKTLVVAWWFFKLSSLAPSDVLLLIFPINLLHNSGFNSAKNSSAAARRPPPRKAMHATGMEPTPLLHANMSLGCPRCAYAYAIFILWVTTLLSILALRTWWVLHSTHSTPFPVVLNSNVR